MKQQTTDFDRKTTALAAALEAAPHHAQQEAVAFWAATRRSAGCGSTSTGTGKLTPGENTVICMYRMLSPAAKRLVAQMLDIVEGRAEAPAIAS